MGVIQIRGISDEAQERLKERAAAQGQSLSAYLRHELEQLAALPTVAEMVERVGRLTPVEDTETAAESIRAGRAAREAELDLEQ